MTFTTLPYLYPILFSDSDSDSEDLAILEALSNYSDEVKFMGSIRKLTDILQRKFPETGSSTRPTLSAKCRKRPREKVKAEDEAESSRCPQLRKGKEQAEAESSRLRERAKEKAEADSLRRCNFAHNSIARDFKEVPCDRIKSSKEVSDASSSKIMYAGAVLDVCYWIFWFYPEIVSFVQHEMVNFPSVKGQYSYNQPPKLIMLDDAGQCKAIIRIDYWKREHILQFLRENLKPTSGV